MTGFRVLPHNRGSRRAAHAAALPTVPASPPVSAGRPDAAVGADSVTLYRRLLGYMLPYWQRFLVAVLGMTVAALQALALRDSLARGRKDLPRRYFRVAAKPIGVAWRFATGADLSQPEVEGHRPLSARIANGYVERLLTACETDVALAEQLIRVTGFIDPPTQLVRPKVMYRVARTRPRR